MVATSELAILISSRDNASKVIDGLSKSIGNVGKAAAAPVRALGSLGGALGDVVKLGAGFATGGLIASAPGALLDMAKSAAADEQATARLAQTLRNLPGDFDQMTGAVNDAIASGQKLAFSDDDIRDSFQFLATATGDSNEALKRQKVALDLARGANIPLAQASKLVGKVNEENVETFKKLGITIGEGASEAEALAAIQGKFAGQAEAYANSTAGQFEQAQLAVAEISESIGSALLPVLAAVGRVLADNLPAIQAFVGGLATAVSDLLGPALAQLMQYLPPIGVALGQVFAFMRDGTGDIEVFRGVLTKLIGPAGAQGVIEVFTNLVGFFRTKVMPLWQALAEAAQKALGGDLAGALQDAAAALGAYGREVVSNLAEWARRFVEWVAPFVPPMLAELGKMLVQLGSWLLTVALPAIVTQLAEWALAFVQWVAPLIPPLLVELGRLYLELQRWMLTVALPAIITALVQWGAAFLGWVVKDVLPALPGELAKINKAVVDFLIQAATDFLAEAGRTGAALLKGFMDELGKLAGQAWTAVAGDQADSLKSKLYSALKDAIDHAVAGVKSWIDDLIAPFRRAWDTIKGLLDKIRGGKSEVEAPPSGGGGGRSTISALGGGALRPASITIYNDIDARGQPPQLVAQAWGMTLGEAMQRQLISGVR